MNYSGSVQLLHDQLFGVMQKYGWENRHRWGCFFIKPYARQFYKSKAWQRTREAYAKSKRNLCEVCLAKGVITPAEIVHHKIEITPENITDPTVTLSWNNLQCVCRECHAEAHGARQNRWKIDELGRVYAKE